MCRAPGWPKDAGRLGGGMRIGPRRYARVHHVNEPSLTYIPRSDRASTLAVVIIASFLTPFMMSSLNVALPEIGKQFSLSAVALSWVVTAHVIAAAVLLLPAGRIADIHGRRRIFLYGMIVFTLGMLLSAIANSATALFIARIVNGIGSSMVFSTGVAIIMSVVAPAERGHVLGWNVAAVYLGLSVGPVIGGVIAHAFGWRWIFGLATIIAAVTCIITSLHLREEPPDTTGAHFDLIGSVLFGISLASFLAGCSFLPGTVGAGLFVTGIASAILFIRWELKCACPIFDVAHFKSNSVFMFSNAAALINYAATAATAFLLSLYLEYVKGFSPKHTGLILVAQPIVMTIFSPVAGRLSDRIEPGRMASVGMAISAAGLFLFSFLGHYTPVWFVVAGLCVLGFGFALFSSPNTNAVMSSVERQHYGTASSTLATMRLTGQMTSMAIVTLIEAIILGKATIGPSNTHLYVRCMHIAFFVFFVLCVLGIFASAVRGRTRRQPTTDS